MAHSAGVKRDRSLEPVWDELYPSEQARILQLLIERIDVAPDGISSRCMLRGFAALSRSWRASESAKEAMPEAAE